MKKCKREIIEKYSLFGEQCFVTEHYEKNMFVVLTDKKRDKLGRRIEITKGKELKGYLGDILYIQYTGDKYGERDIILKSDRHGVVCKWKGE